MEFSQICGDLLLKHLGSQMPHWGSPVSVQVPAPRLEALTPSLTCSAAACLTVSAGTPRVSGSSHCWWCCRCDSSAPARPVCCSAPRPSASSAPAPACAPENKPLARQSSHLYPLSFSDSFFLCLTCSSAQCGSSERLSCSSPSHPGGGWLFWSWISAASSPSSPQVL